MNTVQSSPLFEAARDLPLATSPIASSASITCFAKLLCSTEAKPSERTTISFEAASILGTRSVEGADAAPPRTQHMLADQSTDNAFDAVSAGFHDVAENSASGMSATGNGGNRARAPHEREAATVRGSKAASAVEQARPFGMTRPVVGARAKMTGDVTRPGSPTTPRARPTQGATHALLPVSVHKCELGLFINARAVGASANDILRLRNETEWLLARQGYRAASFVVNAREELRTNG